MNERSLRNALALDDEELDFLRGAALPALLLGRIASERRAARRERLFGVLWVILPAALGYVGWLAAAPVLGQWLALARQTGMTALIAAQLINAGWGALDLFASIVEAASAVPGFNAPLILVSLLAALTYALGLGVPSVRRRAAAV